MQNSTPIVINPITTTQQVVSQTPISLLNPVITASLTSQVIPVHTEASLNVLQEKTTTTAHTSVSSQNLIPNDTASNANTNQQPIQQNVSEQNSVSLAAETTASSNPATSPNVIGTSYFFFKMP